MVREEDGVDDDEFWGWNCLSLADLSVQIFFFFPILGRVLCSAGLSACPPCKGKGENETCLLVRASVPASVSAEAAAAGSTSAGGELAREETMVLELVPRDWWVESLQC